MKTQQDPRHQKRINKFKDLFAYSFNNSTQENSDSIKDIIKKLKKIDKLIQKSAPEWPVTRLNKVDLAILRLAVYELLIENKIPPKVVIDEAVEIGKMYGSDSTSKFVNGVLGSLIKNKKS